MPTLARLPGLALVAVLTALAALLAGLPGLGVMGPLGVALLVGLAWRAAVGLPAWARPGSGYAARTLLRLGIVLLGVRLDFALVATVGPGVLGLVTLVVGLGIVGVERLGKLLGLSRGLRLALAFGSGVCGASAAVAAGGVAGSSDEEVSVAVGTVSLLGTLGVVGYILGGEAMGLSSERYGLLTGATLQEVGQVLAAGFAMGPAAGDLATLVKLTRVALLAPALFVASAVLRRRGGSVPGEARPALFPAFLVGFLLAGAARSSGLLPPGVLGAAQTASVWLTAAAMAGIGLGVDLGAARRVGGAALALGGAGFLLLVLVAVAYTGLVGR